MLGGVEVAGQRADLVGEALAVCAFDRGEIGNIANIGSDEGGPFHGGLRY